MEVIPYFNSPEWERVKSKLDKDGISHTSCIVVDIGHDGFSVFKHTPSRSTWGVWLRVKNASPRVSFRHMNVREVALWPQSSKVRYDG